MSQRGVVSQSRKQAPSPLPAPQQPPPRGGETPSLPACLASWLRCVMVVVLLLACSRTCLTACLSRVGSASTGDELGSGFHTDRASRAPTPRRTFAENLQQQQHKGGGGGEREAGEQCQRAAYLPPGPAWLAEEARAMAHGWPWLLPACLPAPCLPYPCASSMVL